MAAITAPQQFLSLFVPTGLFEALEAGTRTFMLALFLELLDQRCAHLVLQDGELVPTS